MDIIKSLYFSQQHEYIRKLLFAIMGSNYRNTKAVLNEVFKDLHPAVIKYYQLVLAGADMPVDVVVQANKAMVTRLFSEEFASYAAPAHRHLLPMLVSNCFYTGEAYIPYVLDDGVIKLVDSNLEKLLTGPSVANKELETLRGV